MHEPDEFVAFIKLVASRLDGAGIPYMLTGSVAQAVYSAPRMTRDIDLVVDARPEHVATLVRLFAPDCYIDRDAVGAAVRSRGMFNIIHNGWIIKADFIVRKDDAFRVGEFDRRRCVELDGSPIRIVSVEDLILSKLAWARAGASALQTRDVHCLLRDTPDLDWNYLERWARHLDVWQLLQSARQP